MTAVVGSLLLPVGNFNTATTMSEHAVQAAPAPSKNRVEETITADPFVAEINKLIRQSWEDNEVKPSPVASDSEWIRRVYLDIVGHIPPYNTVEQFLANKDPQKRAKLIDELLNNQDYTKNWTTVWTNLLIGRQTPERTSRVGMEKFLREAFARNRPWNDVVYDLLTATGHYEENGAVNYLLGQMTARDEGVQATAKTTRLFLGTQVQCTQCHNHPFNDWQQNQFWEFNSFLREARRVDHDKYDPKTGDRVDDYSELVDRKMESGVYYEKRNGQMQAAYPKYFGEKVEIPPGVNRRVVFGELVRQDHDKVLAKAMVNRMWSEFFGQGFTRPVDDMGPHNPTSHPKLLELLANEYAKENYDSKKLMRWICNTEAYSLSSQVTPENKIDDPSAGEMPLFSHMYVKQMEAEQLYDSLLVATNADQTGNMGYDEILRQRQMWLRQFITSFGTDEGDESSTFNGSIPQALMMMNGPLINKAIDFQSGSFLYDVVLNSKDADQRIRKLYLAALSRLPNRSEVTTANRLVGQNPDSPNGYQDLFWALLNSNEFIMVH
jgi:hypothetical protein